MSQGVYGADSERLLQHLRESGITDLNGVVERIASAEAPAEAEPRIIVCNSEHYCIVVKPL